MEITTIKLKKITKKRLDKLKSHKRETYDDILEKTLEILNTCRIDPGKARIKLIQIDKLNRAITSKNKLSDIKPQ